MSGLCGWFSREPAALPIERMAAPLCRYDSTPLRSAAHSLGAAALAGGLDCAGLYHEDGLLIAYWGERVEALARLWRAHGAKACAALSGHFAFALIDERRGEALLAVDRCATRPLFYQQVGHTLLFASSADALALHPGAGREVEPQALYNFLHLHAVPGPAAVYKGQRRLAPGEFLHLHGGRVERARYWRLRFTEHEPDSLPGLKSELLDTMRSAVESSRGQQKIAVMLGGGAHSAALAALLQAVDGGRVPTCAVGAGSQGRLQLAAARAVARHLHTDHHEREIGASDAADAIPRLAALFDQPCGDPGALAAYHCALAAREAGALRVLGGQGGAILFGGRAAYAHQRRLARYERLPSALRQLLLEPLLFRLGGRVRSGPLAAARAGIEHAMQPLPARLHQASLLHGYGADKVFEAGFLAAVDPTAPAALQEQAWWLAQGRAEVNRMIALDLQYALVDQGLPLLSRACELAGVDAAFPYLHDGVVAFAARLDPRRKIDGAAANGLLRGALRAMLPARLPAAGGDGFQLPFGQWLQTDARLRSIAFDSLADLRARHVVRGAFIDELLARRLPEQPSRHGAMVWMLMMLEQWFAARRPGAGSEPVVPARARVAGAARE
ncbi:MAG: asparagine synthetase B family protein [Massilia sp.]